MTYAPELNWPGDYWMKLIDSLWNELGEIKTQRLLENKFDSCHWNYILSLREKRDSASMEFLFDPNRFARKGACSLESARAGLLRAHAWKKCN